MKIIILEGIATSGKTSVKNKLAEAFVEKGIYKREKAGFQKRLGIF